MQTDPPPTTSAPLDAVVQEGLRIAGEVGHPIARLRHQAAWAFRLSKVDPNNAEALVTRFSEDPGLQAQLLLSVVYDRIARSEDVTSEFEAAITHALAADVDVRVRVLNALSEAAIQLGDRDPAAAIELLERLESPARELTGVSEEDLQPRALASALVGEALLVLGSPHGRALLEEVATWCAELYARDPILGFIAGALLESDPARAVALTGELQDPAQRMQVRLQLLEKVQDPALRSALMDGAEQDAVPVEHWHGPEAFVRLAHGLAPYDAARARSYFERVLERVREQQGQARALQEAGVATAVAATDLEWADTLFRAAIESVEAEPEPVRRVTSLVAIAGEMAEPFPREAADIFARAMEEAAGLTELWELAHTLELVFRPDRSPYLDIAPARPLLERALERMSGDEPHIPGMFGLPEVSRYLAEVAPERAVEALTLWFEGAAQSGDTDSMTHAGVQLHRLDAEAGRVALARTRDLLLDRIDCPAMGEYSRAVAPVIPEFVEQIAPRIPGFRERAEALGAVADAIYDERPDEALELIRAIERPIDRSAALLALVDRRLGTADRFQPPPLLEDLP